jgi:hypothetical protein
MEDFLSEPVELTEADLHEVAGGGERCGCGPFISVELELELEASVRL